MNDPTARLLLERHNRWTAELVMEHNVARFKIGKDNFDDVVNRSGIVLVDCWAPWCAACRDFAPVFEGVAENRPGHLFATLNTEDEPEITESAGVSHIPTLMLYRDGVLLLKHPGYVDRAGLEDIVDQAEALDMDMVRTDMAAQASEHD